MLRQFMIQHWMLTIIIKLLLDKYYRVLNEKILQLKVKYIIMGLKVNWKNVYL